MVCVLSVCVCVFSCNFSLLIFLVGFFLNSGLFFFLFASLFSKESWEKRHKLEWVGKILEEFGDRRRWSEYIIWKKIVFNKKRNISYQGLLHESLFKMAFDLSDGLDKIQNGYLVQINFAYLCSDGRALPPKLQVGLSERTNVIVLRFCHRH